MNDNNNLVVVVLVVTKNWILTQLHLVQTALCLASQWSLVHNRTPRNKSETVTRLNKQTLVCANHDQTH